jgi:hypothetical protein
MYRKVSGKNGSDYITMDFATVQQVMDFVLLS